MTYPRKLLSIGLVFGVVFVGVLLPANSARAISIAELTALVQELTRQLETLKKQLEAGTSVSGLFPADIRYGIRNNSGVRRLQQFLIDNGYLGKDFATGNFFTLTRDALRRFQQANKIPVTGLLDAKTREVINALVEKQTNAEALIVKTATSTPVVMETTTTTIQTETRTEYRLDPRPVYDATVLERAVFDAVNGERQKYGLNALIWNEQLAMVARSHSADQAGDNTIITNSEVACLYPFIRHEGFVSGFKVGNRLDRAGVPYQLAGENIITLPITKELIYRATRMASACTQAAETEGILGETEQEARSRVAAVISERIGLMAGQESLDWVNREWKGVIEIANESAADWMNSPGHRHNILTGEFEEGAIGAAFVNDYIILTQVFLKRPAL